MHNKVMISSEYEQAPTGTCKILPWIVYVLVNIVGIPTSCTKEAELDHSHRSERKRDQSYTAYTNVHYTFACIILTTWYMSRVTNYKRSLLN